MPTSPRVKRPSSSSSDPPASKRTKVTDGLDNSTISALRGFTMMQAITGSGALTRVELSVPTAGTAKLKVYECIRDVKAWMTHGTNAQDYAHDSREVFCKYGCGESWTGPHRHQHKQKDSRASMHKACAMHLPPGTLYQAGFCQSRVEECKRVRVVQIQMCRCCNRTH